MPPDDTAYTTVADAAALLNVTERRLRRLLSLPEYAARTETLTRQTRTGTRQALVIPAALLAEIQQRIESEKRGENTNTAAAQRNAADSADTAVKPGTTPLVRAESMFLRVIEDRDKTIERQEEEIRFLREQMQELMRRVPVVVPQAQEESGRKRRWWEFWKRDE